MVTKTGVWWETVCRPWDREDARALRKAEEELRRNAGAKLAERVLADGRAYVVRQSPVREVTEGTFGDLVLALETLVVLHNPLDAAPGEYVQWEAFDGLHREGKTVRLRMAQDAGDDVGVVAVFSRHEVIRPRFRVWVWRRTDGLPDGADEPILANEKG